MDISATARARAKHHRQDRLATKNAYGTRINCFMKHKRNHTYMSYLLKWKSRVSANAACLRGPYSLSNTIDLNISLGGNGTHQKQMRYVNTTQATPRDLICSRQICVSYTCILCGQTCTTIQASEMISGFHLNCTCDWCKETISLTSQVGRHTQNKMNSIEFVISVWTWKYIWMCTEHAYIYIYIYALMWKCVGLPHTFK